jgi:hypothetical protein
MRTHAPCQSNAAVFVAFLLAVEPVSMPVAEKRETQQK